MDCNVTYRQKNNSWQYIISYKDNLGKWKQKSKQGFELSREGKKACKEAAEDAVKDLKKQIMMEPVSQEYLDIAFEDLAEIFINQENRYKAANTVEIYKIALTNFKEISSTTVGKITPVLIQNCVNSMIEKKLKTSTIKLYLRKVNAIFEYACTELHIIPITPVQKIKIPEDKYETQKTALTKLELNTLLSKIKNRKIYLMSLIAAKCGLRIGEILGLTWNTINFNEKVIKVQQQWKLLSGGIYDFGSLKSKYSPREVPMPPIVISELEKYREEYMKNKKDRLFMYNNDSACSNTSVEYEKVGFNLSIHELRHTYITNLIADGVDFKTAAKLAGHSVEETIKRYSHVNNDMMNNAIKIINNENKIETNKIDGITKGKSEFLILLLTKKFKKVSDEYKQKINLLPEETIGLIGIEIFEMKSIEEIEQYF